MLPLVEVAIAAARGTNAPPLRLYGNAGHCINWGIVIIAFSFIPVAALLFYGVSILLAFVRGYAGCEILAISNWVRRRDDQIVCPIFSPIDHAEAAAPESTRHADRGRLRQAFRLIQLGYRFDHHDCGQAAPPPQP